MTDIETAVLAILSSHTKVRPVTAESSFVVDLGFDSLDIIPLVNDLEEKFEIDIPNGLENGWSSAKDIIAYLHTQEAACVAEMPKKAGQ